MAASDKKGFKGFPKKAVIFFLSIKGNNNKAWFEEHKQDYLENVLKPAQELVRDLSGSMLKIDPQINTNPAKIIARIYRDVRFSKDKSPYKSRLFFTFKRPGDEWMDAPGFYFEIDHESYGFGMGIYDASLETMKTFRAKIEADPAEFFKTTAFYRKKGSMFELGGDRYKRPKFETKNEKLREWFMMKNFYFYCHRPADKILTSPKLEALMEKGYKELAPLYKYLWKLKG